MSHITEIKLKINDLSALADAAKHCNLVFMEGQTKHAWYGHFVGDSQVPEGRDPKDYGTCEHALRLADHQAGDYEIGLVPALDGNGYDMMLDTWGPGHRVAAACGGPSLDKLRQEYAVAVTTKNVKKTLGRRGWQTSRVEMPGGTVRLKVRRR